MEFKVLTLYVEPHRRELLPEANDGHLTTVLLYCQLELRLSYEQATSCDSSRQTDKTQTYLQYNHKC